MKLTILGSNAACPANGKYTSAQVLNINEKLFLIDAGEGVQVQLANLQVKRSKINHIFISHLHGDHILGLPGLLGSFGLQGRTEPLHIYSPKGLEEWLTVYLRISYVESTPFPLVFHELDTNQGVQIFENKDCTIHTISLQHGVPTVGFLFKEKPLPRKMIKEKIAEYQIPYQLINDIKAGADFTTSLGQVIPNDELTLPAPPPRSFAYCSDTGYFEALAEVVKEVNLLYHEATFGMDVAEKLAEHPVHSSTHQAATIAAKAKVKKLIIGHFSPRYKDLTPLLEEAKSIFPNTDLAVDGCIFEIERI